MSETGLLFYELASWPRALLDLPGVALIDEVLDLAFTFRLFRDVDLLSDPFIKGERLDLAEDPDRAGQLLLIRELSHHGRRSSCSYSGVPDRGFFSAAGLKPPSVEAQPLVQLLSILQLLTRHQVDRLLVPDLTVSDVIEAAVIEDHAVLEDLDEGCPLVSRSRLQDPGHVLNVRIDRPSHEGRVRAEGEVDGIEGPIDASER